MDFYKVLGVRREATPEEVKRAFRKLALQFHPDRHAQASRQQQETAARRFRDASEAYKVLIDPFKRALYNREGRAPRHAAPSSPPRNQHYSHRYYTSSPPHRSFWSLRFSLSPLDIAFHTLFAGTLIVGLCFGDYVGKALWDDRNAGKSFEDIIAAKHHKKK